MQLPKKMPKLSPAMLVAAVLLLIVVLAVVVWLVVKLILYITILLCVFGFFDFMIKRKELIIEEKMSCGSPAPKISYRKPFRKVDLNF